MISASRNSPAGTNVFGKECRIRSAAEFRHVYEKGNKRVSRSFLVFVLENGTEKTRFGLTTPKKLGKAHERNRIKRRVREILRTSRNVVPVGRDVVINPKRSTMERPIVELRDELLSLLTREA